MLGFSHFCFDSAGTCIYISKAVLRSPFVVRIAKAAVIHHALHFVWLVLKNFLITFSPFMLLQFF
jgi:hypothetical protein